MDWAAALSAAIDQYEIGVLTLALERPAGYEGEPTVEVQKLLAQAQKMKAYLVCKQETDLLSAEQVREPSSGAGGLDDMAHPLAGGTRRAAGGDARGGQDE